MKRSNPGRRAIPCGPLVTLACALGVAACSDSQSGLLAPDVPAYNFGSSSAVRVTNSNDAGPGSFRQAILQANSDDDIRRIEFSFSVGTIALQQPIVYAGAQSLDIDAKRATLNGLALTAGQTAFSATGGGNLSISGLTVRNAPGPGLTVAVPAGASGTIKVSLLNVTSEFNGSHGVLINDQDLYFSNPNSTSTGGSPASLEVIVIASRFKENGHTDLDQDGLRINEGGLGGLKVVVSATRVEGNGGDRIEFDERADGDINFSVSGSELNGNGRFTSVDFDDGIDIDEGGPGSIIGNFLYEEDDDVAGGGDIIARLIGIKTRGNAAGDAGLKLREKGAGNLDARLIGIESSGNLIDGVLLRDDADGNLTGSITGVSTTGNTGDGIEFDENGAGDLDGTVERGNSSNNTVAGIRADQGGAGLGALRLVAVTTNGNPGGAVVVNAGVTVM